MTTSNIEPNKGGAQAALRDLATPLTQAGLDDEAIGRLDAQFAFLIEAEGLKSVLRANQVMDRTRFENTGEHSWHACMAAYVFAPLAAADVDLTRALEMLVLHDIVEIDAGDHPIHISHDPASVAALETAAAERIYGLLPEDIGRRFRAIWDEFEAMESPTARFAKSIDYLTPALQSIGAPERDPLEDDIVSRNLTAGRALKTRDMLPELYAFTLAGFEGKPRDPILSQCFDFWCRLDALKSVNRASKVIGMERFENSAEHSWHVMLYALTLSDHASADVSLGTALEMLMLHDIVEIYAGDNPIHGTVSPEQRATQEAEEQAAADRLFALLPDDQARKARATWDDFEAAQSPTAKFAKAIDRIPPLLQNLAHEGGSWADYNVTLPQMEDRVGAKITPGAPKLWHYLRARIAPWFAQNSRT